MNQDPTIKELIEFMKKEKLQYFIYGNDLIMLKNDNSIKGFRLKGDDFK